MVPESGAVGRSGRSPVPALCGAVPAGVPGGAAALPEAGRERQLDRAREMVSSLSENFPCWPDRWKENKVFGLALGPQISRPPPLEHSTSAFEARKPEYQKMRVGRVCEVTNSKIGLRSQDQSCGSPSTGSD